MRRALLALPLLAVLAMPIALAGCTSSGGNTSSAPAPSTIVRTVTQTNAPSSSAASSPVPIKAGPTKAAAASSCPLLTTPTAADKGGMRLGRITVLKAGNRVVGCRFYGQQQPSADCPQSCLTGEHLPPGTQPVIEITTTRYRTAVDAHNAIVLIARKGTAPQQVSIGLDNIGVCYQNDFYPKDNGKDWACTFSIAKLAVVVNTVAESASARALSVAVASKL